MSPGQPPQPETMAVNALRGRPARRHETHARSILQRMERRLGITISGVALLGVFAIAWAIGRRLGSRPVLALAYGLLLLIGLAMVLARRRVVIDVGRSKIPGRVREGQEVEVELSLTARRRVSTIMLEEVLPEHLGGPVRFPIPALSKGADLSCSYSFTPNRRGKYSVGPLVAEWSDPFGLTSRRLVLDDPIAIMVHPTTELVHDRMFTRAWEDPPIRPPLSKKWPIGFEFYGMRDYVSGDDPRRIVWRATARSLDLKTGIGRYLVREAEQGITDRVQIFLDTDRTAHSPGETSETFELSVRAAASLGVKHLNDGFAVSVNTNGGPPLSTLRGRRAKIELLDRLAVVEREGVRLTSALDRLMVGRGGRSHNLVVTPHIDRDAAIRLRVILDRGTSVLLVLVLWEDTDPATLQRAGALGCEVVEITTGAPLERVFRHALAGRR